MRRSFRTRVYFSEGFPRLAPWAGMRCPFRAWDRKHHRSICPNGATHTSPMERDSQWEMRTGSKRHRSICPKGATHTNPMERDSQWECARDRNTIVPFAPTGQRIPAQWNVIPSGSAHGIETPSFHLPQRGNAYQPNGTGFPVGAWARDRNVIVLLAPTGQRIPAQGANPGNRIPEKRCVLKEHRIGRPGIDLRDTKMMQRSRRAHGDRHAVFE